MKPVSGGNRSRSWAMGRDRGNLQKGVFVKKRETASGQFVPLAVTGLSSYDLDWIYTIPFSSQQLSSTSQFSNITHIRIFRSERY